MGVWQLVTRVFLTHPRCCVNREAPHVLPSIGKGKMRELSPIEGEFEDQLGEGGPTSTSTLFDPGYERSGAWDRVLPQRLPAQDQGHAIPPAGPAIANVASHVQAGLSFQSSSLAPFPTTTTSPRPTLTSTTPTIHASSFLKAATPPLNILPNPI
ncbi:hypothetical protein CVT26_004360 [Gymnopilus dilepis]|uniref:Uncharacterized protein n=1 Tax=Gymnopilus dilepis TaxID=231916 RepID=A0A409W6T6_9AGAR|nr:hypothetical protein CVT26_004360 [Gymnopilus dilepis]